MLAPIQPDESHHDRAELLAVGRDVAIVYSYESSTLEPSRRHDVYFQWWRYHSSSDTWRPEPAVRVFDSPDDRIGYSRALIARDSQGRLWIQAFRLERDGRSTAVVSVSTNGGRELLAPAGSGLGAAPRRRPAAERGQQARLRLRHARRLRARAHARSATPAIR